MKNFIFSLLLIFSLFSCKFYYNTSDINSKLKSTSVEVSSNCDKLSSQIDNYKSEYLKLKCDNETEEQKKALSLFEEINSSLNEMISLRRKTIDEYSNFLIYTKGKDKIQTGTNEWKSFKNTKKQFKTALKSIQKIGNNTIKKAEELNKLVSEKIVPKIQKCVVADYQKSIKSVVDSLIKLEVELPVKIKDYANKVSVITNKFQLSFPNQCQELEMELSKFKGLSIELSSIVNEVNGISREFQSRTKGVEFIYSCSTDWSFIMKLEQDIKKEQSNLNNLYLKMQGIQNQIKTIVTQMK